MSSSPSTPRPPTTSPCPRASASPRHAAPARPPPPNENGQDFSVPAASLAIYRENRLQREPSLHRTPGRALDRGRLLVGHIDLPVLERAFVGARAVLQIHVPATI